MFVFFRKEVRIYLSQLKSKRATFFSPSKRPRMKSEIKAQIEADVKIKIEPVEEFNRSMEIIKGGLISESFSLQIKSIKRFAKSLSTLSIFYL